MPTRAMVGQARSQIIDITGSLVVYERPKFSCADCGEVPEELVELGPVEPELALELEPLGLGQVAAAEEVPDRVRLDDPEEEEVEADDEDERRERGEDLPGDEPEAHVPATPVAIRYSRSSAVRRRRTRYTMSTAPASPAATRATIEAVDIPPPPSSELAAAEREVRVGRRRVREDHGADVRRLSQPALEPVRAIRL